MKRYKPRIDRFLQDGRDTANGHRIYGIEDLAQLTPGTLVLVLTNRGNHIEYKAIEVESVKTGDCDDCVTAGCRRLGGNQMLIGRYNKSMQKTDFNNHITGRREIEVKRLFVDAGQVYRIEEPLLLGY